MCNQSKSSILSIILKKILIRKIPTIRKIYYTQKQKKNKNKRVVVIDDGNCRRPPETLKFT